MSFLPASRTRRLLLKVASLGLAGFLAGLFSGCNTAANTEGTQLTSNTAVSGATSESQSSRLPRSLDATQIPALRHPPSARRLQLGSVHTASMAMMPNGHNRS
jgi:hypothetical protein